MIRYNASEDTTDNNSSTNNSNNSNDGNNNDQNNQNDDNNSEQSSSTTENNSQDTTTNNDVDFAITDSEERFDGVLRVDDSMVTIEINSEVTRNYIIVHFIDHNGVQQNVQLVLNGVINGKSQWIYSTQHFDLSKPFTFTLQDSKFGQFESIAYLAANLAINTDNTAENNSNNTSDSSNNSNHNDDQRIEVNEARFSLLAAINQSNGAFNITLNAKQERAYVIIHYVDKQGIPQNRHLIRQENNHWQLDANSFDQNKGFSLTIDDPRGQFSTERYVF